MFVVFKSTKDKLHTEEGTNNSIRALRWEGEEAGKFSQRKCQMNKSLKGE